MTDDRQPGSTPTDTPEPLVSPLLRALTLIDPEPPGAVEAARAAFASRTTDADIASLVKDSMAATAAADLAGGDHPVALLTFESDHAVIELSVTGGADRQLVGQLLARSTSPYRIAPAEILVEHPSGPTAIQSDEHGRFVASGLTGGPMRLWCYPPRPGPRVVSDWVAV